MADFRFGVAAWDCNSLTLFSSLAILFLLLVGRQLEDRRRGAVAAIDAADLGDAVPVGEELVILLLRNRIVLVIVAAAAADGQAEPDGAGGIDAIDDVIDARLLGDAAAFAVEHVIAMEAGRDLLRDRRRLGSMSPAICSMVNWSNGMFLLKASITQSRQGHMARLPSV